MEASDWNETSELKYLTHWMPLPSPPDDVAAPTEQQAAQASGVLKAIREANMQLVRTGDGAFMLVPYQQAHVQNPAEIEHVAGDVSKNGAESNMKGAAYAPMPRAAYIEFDGREETAWHTPDQMRAFADRTHALRMEQAASKAAPGVGNSGFDHKTAADFLSGKTVSDEAVRKFVQASRWAHDEKASLSAMLLSVRGELASRNAEIALLKRALMEAEAAPAPNLAKALNQKTLQNDSLHTRSEHDNT